VDARKTIPAFDAYLVKRGLGLRATVIGGAALQLMGVTARPTKDCDVLDPTLPVEILQAANDFAASRASEQLQPGWFNNGPASLLRTLPVEWSDRLQSLYSGARARAAHARSGRFVALEAVRVDRPEHRLA
jgi:hypothetical protein